MDTNPSLPPQLEVDDGRRLTITGYVMTNDNLETALDAWCTDEAAATATYGDVKTWNTEGVTSMKGLMSPRWQKLEAGNFCNNCRPHMSTCNPEIGGWNTEAVTDMR